MELKIDYFPNSLTDAILFDSMIGYLDTIISKESVDETFVITVFESGNSSSTSAIIKVSNT